MKKILLFVMFFGVLCVSPSFAEAKYGSNYIMKGGKESAVGTQGGLLSITKGRYNEQGQLIGASGINLLGLGYTSTYYKRPVQTHSWNPYWHWGTVVIAIPYIGIGTEYVWNSGFFCGLKTYYVFPQLELGFRF